MVPGAQNYFAKDRYRDVEGILQIVKDGLCHRCGACVGVCPAGTFDLDSDGYPIQVADCINCNICVQSCSGVEVDYNRIGKLIFDGRYEYGSLMGPVMKAYVAHAAEPDIRRMGASGGACTQLMLHLLESGAFKGALVAVEDPDDPALGKGIIARTREEIVRAAQSKYTTTPSMAALAEIRDDEGPYVMVGLPCQFHALRKRQLVDPRWKQRIPLTIGLHCHINPPAFSTRELASVLKPNGAKLEHVRYRQSRPGEDEGWPDNKMEMDFSDGTTWRSPVSPIQMFNVLARIGSLSRCTTCVDQTAEFTDLAVADPWIRDENGEWKFHHTDGWSSILVRTPYGEEVIQEAVKAGKLVAEEIDPEEVERGQKHVMTAKKRRVGMRIQARKMFGLQVPEYHVELPPPTLKTLRKELLYRAIRLGTSIRFLRRLAVRMALSSFGKVIFQYTRNLRKKQYVRGKLD